MKAKYYYTLNENATICLCRVFGQTPEVVIPETIDGKVVTDISAYCFSAVQKLPEHYFVYEDEADAYVFEQAGKDIKTIVFPSSVSKVGSYAFYNCRKLEKIVFHSNFKELGTDVFLNCLSLHQMEFYSPVESTAILKHVLKQISWDIEIFFKEENALFLFPEYYENYNVIGPTHIFGFNMAGEGFRARQCFKNNSFQIQEYDAIFEKLCSEENEKTLCSFALNRILYPFSLQEPDLKKYEQYIKEHSEKIGLSILMDPKKEINIKIDQLEYCIKKLYINSDAIDLLIEAATNEKMAELSTCLIQWKHTYFFKKKTYDFEDF